MDIDLRRLPLAACVADALGRALDANAAWRALLPGDGALEGLTPEDQATLDALLAGAEGPVDVRLRSPGGHLAVRLVAGQAPGGRLVVLTDAGDLALARAARDAHAAELERFAYLVSHDLKAPLRTASGFAGLLQSRFADALSADARRYLARVVQGVDRMQSMLDDLLIFSRIRAPQPTAVDADALAREILQDVGADGVEVGPLPTVRGDPGQIELLFREGLDNALKFHALGEPPRVALRAAREGAAWRFEIQDQGVGLDEAYAPRAFELFRRLHGGRWPGNGAGLAHARRVVEGHGGAIELRGAPGAGATLIFTLPAG